MVVSVNVYLDNYFDVDLVIIDKFINVFFDVFILNEGNVFYLSCDNFEEKIFFIFCYVVIIMF